MSIIHRVLDKDIHLLKLNCPLYGCWAKELEAKFQDAFARGARQMVLDLEEVTFVDCTGLAALVAGYRLFGSRQQNFRLVGLQDQPKLLLELTMFDRIFQVFDTVFEATGSKPVRPLQPTVSNFAVQPTV
ncbi:MAG: STAS domain-containing protein [Anaerolineae bacterium]|nr:STAS domain-containing protein [Anaerolineae bacterium]